jgi:DNA primase
MRLSNETIDRIHQQIDIIEVVGDFVSLKKKGLNYWACCPFHNEKSPSFAVNPAKGIFKCFGCGKSGDAITFVQELEGLSYPEAMKYFAKKYGIEIAEDEPRNEEEVKQQNERDSLYIVLNYAKNYFADLLMNNEDGRAIGLSYFQERGFSEATIKKFELGYSLDEWDGLLKTAVQNGYKTEMLEKAGLILARENADRPDRKHYDRFRGRVVFPIHNLSGKPIAFGARILKNDKNQPKYINSPETEVYHKSKILYGIYQAKNSIRNEDNCFLVEGYTDVISLHQAGVENVVASSGTSLTEDQIRLIKRYSENITVLYDGDPAGIKASLRGIDMILEEGLNVNVVLFPDNDDPDSYVRKIGGEKFKEFIKNNKKDFISFKTELFLEETANDPIKKAGIIKDIVTSIAKIPDGIKRALFFRQCSKLMEIDEQVLISEYNKVELKRRQDKSRKNDTPPEFTTYTGEQEYPEYPVITEEPESDTDKLLSQLQDHELSILKLIILLGGEIVEGHKVVEYLLTETQDVESNNPLYLKIRNAIVDELNKGNEITKAFFLENDDQDIKKLAIDFMVDKYQISDRWEKFGIIVPKDSELIEQNTPKAVLKYKRLFAKYLIREKRKELTNTKEAEQEMQIIQEIMTLQQFEKQVDKMLGIVVG